MIRIVRLVWVSALGLLGADLLVASAIIVSHESRAYVFRWDGATWQRITGFLSGNVYALAVYQGDLVAGGLCTIPGSSTTSLARWDGDAWRSLGVGVDR